MLTYHLWNMVLSPMASNTSFYSFILGTLPRTSQLLDRHGLVGKESTCNAGDTGASGSMLGWEDPLEEEMAARFSILA